MFVDYGSGNFFDADTWEYVDLFYDEGSGRFYNNLTGQEVELIGDGINAARDALIGIFGRQGYPNTGRNQQTGYQVQRNPSGGGVSPGSVSSQGVTIKWVGIGIAAFFGASFLLGKRFR